MSLPRSPAQPSATLAALRRAAASAPHIVPACRPLTPITSPSAAVRAAPEPEPAAAALSTSDTSLYSSVTGSVRSTEANFPPVPAFGAVALPVPVAARLAALAPAVGGGARAAPAAAAASPPAPRRAAPPTPPPAPAPRASPAPQYRVQSLFGRAHVTRVVVTTSGGGGGGGGGAGSPARARLRSPPSSAVAPRLSPLHPAHDWEAPAPPSTARAEALPPSPAPRGSGAPRAAWDIESLGPGAAGAPMSPSAPREMMRRYRPSGAADPVSRFGEMNAVWGASPGGAGVFTPSPTSPRRGARGAGAPPPAPPPDPLTARAVAFRALLDTYGVPLEDLKPGHALWGAAKSFLAEGAAVAAGKQQQQQQQQPRAALAPLAANAGRGGGGGGARRAPV